MTDVDELKITKKDTDRIQRLKIQTGLPDKYVNYNYPGGIVAGQRSIDMAKRFTEEGLKASPILPRDDARANIENLQQGRAVNPLPREMHQVGGNLHWGDWKPGGPSVQELVKQLQIQNSKKRKESLW